VEAEICFRGFLSTSSHVSAVIRSEIHEEIVKCGGELDDFFGVAGVGDSDELFPPGMRENGRALRGCGIVPGHKDAEVIYGFAMDQMVERGQCCVRNQFVLIGGFLKRIDERWVVAIDETAKGQESRSDGYHLVRSSLRDRLEDEAPVGSPSVGGAK